MFCKSLFAFLRKLWSISFNCLLMPLQRLYIRSIGHKNLQMLKPLALFETCQHVEEAETRQLPA